MIRLILKQDRLFLLAWILGMAALVLSIPPLLTEMFSTELDRMIMAETMRNPAMIAICGPCYDFDSYGNGAMYAQMMLVWSAALWAVMNIIFVIKHTRKDEEEGRLEMIQVLPVKRLAWLKSVILITAAVNILISLISGFGLYALNVEDMGLHGSLLFGFSIGAAGWFFAGIALVFSQLCSTSRGATEYSFGLLGLAFILRAAGDISWELISYISPLGIICRTEMYVNNYTWPVIVLCLVATVLVILALALNSFRDLNQGVIAAGAGRTHASPLLLTGSVGLSLRLLQTTIFSWLAAVFLLAVSYGSIFGDIESFLDSNDLIKQVFAGDSGGNLNMQFVDTLMLIMAIISTVAVVMVVFKLKSEEKNGRLDILLAQGVTRMRLISGYSAIAVVLAIVLQFFTVLGLWSTSSMVMDTPLIFGEVLKSGFVYVPAMIVFAGLSVTFTGIFPRGTVIVWLYLMYSFLADYLGKMLDFPEWAMKMTPFGLTPKITSDEFEITYLILLCVASAILFIIGFGGFKSRDIR